MSFDAHYWRDGNDTSFVGSRFHVGGALAEAAQALMQVVPNRLYATPLILSRAVTIDGIIQIVSAVSSGVTSQMAVYAVECLSQPFPGRIVAATGASSYALRGGTSSLANNTIVVTSVAAGFQIGDRRLMWMAAIWTGSASVDAVPAVNQWAFFGYDTTSMSVPQSFLVASWGGTVTLPNTYPAGWTVCGSDMPAIGVRITG